MSGVKVPSVVVILVGVLIRTTWQFCPGPCKCINSELKVNCSVPEGVGDWQDGIGHVVGGHHQNKQASSNVGYLNEIPIVFNPQIQILILHGNKIGDLTPYSVMYYTRLVELDLSSNRIVVLGEGSFETLKNLKVLNVSRNRIQVVGKGAFRGLAALQTLDLSGNDIGSIESEETFKPLTFLQELYLDRNRFVHLDLTPFSHLHHLQTLTLSHNKIQTLILHHHNGGSQQHQRHQQHQLVNLLELNLSFNHLEEIGGGGGGGSSSGGNVFGYMPGLLKLDLSHNGIGRVEINALTHNLHLREINLSHNNIQSLPLDFLSTCAQLQTVDLSHNNFRVLPSHYFRNLFKLEWLDVSNNPVEHLDPNALVDNINLVYFYGNHLLQLPHIPLQLLTNKPYLKLFSVQYANIHTLPLLLPLETEDSTLLPPPPPQGETQQQQQLSPGLISSSHEQIINQEQLLPPTHLPLHTLDLKGNPWECNCTAFALYSYIVSQTSSRTRRIALEEDEEEEEDEDEEPSNYFNNIVCASPAFFAAKQLIQLPPETFNHCVQPSDPFTLTVLCLAGSIGAVVLLIILVKILVSTGACARIGRRKKPQEHSPTLVPFHRQLSSSGSSSSSPHHHNLLHQIQPPTHNFLLRHAPAPASSEASGQYNQFASLDRRMAHMDGGGHHHHHYHTGEGIQKNQFHITENYPRPCYPSPPGCNKYAAVPLPPTPRPERDTTTTMMYPTLRNGRLDFSNNQHHHHHYATATAPIHQFDKQVPSVLV